MRRFIRFQTELRSPESGHRLGLFHATDALEIEYELPDYASELLWESMMWFGENLRSPRLPEHQQRSVFWFRSDASECLARIWDMVAVFNECGLYVEQQTTTRPGLIVYDDEHQVAAIPNRR